MRVFMTIYRGYGRVLSGVATLAGICAFALMWLVDANVIARKVFNAPILGSVEIAQALLVWCILLGIPYAQTRGAHLRVTILTGRLPRQVQMGLHVLAMLAGAVVFLLLAHASLNFALRSWRIGDEVWGAAFRFPLWPVKAALPLGATLIAVQFLLDAARIGLFRHCLPHDEITGTDSAGAAHG